MDTLNRVRRLVAEAFHLPIEEVTADTNLRGLDDSLGMIELIMAVEAVEEEFDAAIPEEVAEAGLGDDVRTVGDLAVYIQRWTEGKQE
jgi:acyl carrier protein